MPRFTIHAGRFGLLFVVLVILCSHVTPATALGRSFAQYEHFFPAWDYQIKEQLRNDCVEEITNYRNRSLTRPQTGYQVIDCILRTTPEFRKAELAASTVILGLAPAVLQLLSASYVDTAVLAFRRPGLALLLAMSSSGVRPLSATEYEDFIAKMGTDPFRTNFGNPYSFWAPRVVSAVEYFIACASVANNAYLAYQLSVWAVCTFAPSVDFLPAVWTAASVLIHIVGYFVARLRIKVEAKDDMSLRSSEWRWLWNELVPTPWQSRLEVKNNTKETGVFLGLVSFLYVGTAIQAFYGTIILSSLVFLSVRDSAVVVLRLMASALFARGILIYELAGFRTDREGHGPSDKSDYGLVELRALARSE
ncbi:hypothetical protein CEP51_008942 [Fusarium floridanum]|uniref:TRP C-terminal domain-containing protein n=1 Tax=Fusarium floridanum TaxID=1325733 RepID=A0A428RJ94_9HYPO|nr:hypothetical protein CEP51_008942 [Fusarium floridanum]